MFRFLKQLGCSAALDDFTLMHHGNAICDSRYRQQVVRNIKNAHSELGAERRKQLQNFRLSNQIESAGRLIGNQQRRTMQNSHRNQHALRLTYTQLRRISSQKIWLSGQTDILKGFTQRSAALFSRAAPVDFPGFFQLRTDTQRGVQGGHGTLQDEANFFAAKRSNFSLTQSHQIAAVEVNRTSSFASFQIKKFQNGESQRALTASTLPDQPKYLLLADVQ